MIVYHGTTEVIENMDARYLVTDLIENETGLFNNTVLK